MKSISLLHVIAAMDPKMGGVSEAIRLIIAGLNNYHVLNEVVSLDSPDADYISESSFLIHAVGPATNPWAYNAKLMPWLTENLSRFDVVIVHGLWLFTGYAVEKSLRRISQNPAVSKNGISIPALFVMPHGMLDPYFQQATGRKLKALRNYIYWKLIERNVVNNADGLLFTCEEEKQLARLPFKPYLPKKEMVVGLGIKDPPKYINDMKLAFAEKCTLVHGDSYILFLSRIHEKKGVDILINAYAEIYAGLQLEKQSDGEPGNRKATSNFPKLIIAGPGLETSFGQYIKKLVFDNDLIKDLVYFTGMLTGNAKWGAFYGCDAFILPSHQENFGIAVVEALACSKPVLISNKVNIWREIEDAGGGIIADDTQEGTKRTLQNWTGFSFEERTNMSQRARQCYEDSFSNHSAATKMLAAISQ